MIKLFFNLFKDIYVKHLDEKVEKYYSIYHFSMEPNHTSHNNEADAFKHTYMSAELTILLSPDIAKEIGILQEDTNPHNTDAEREMDLHNNAVGIEIGKKLRKNIFHLINMDNKIAAKVMDAMKNGELITRV